ncbi:DNA-directed RNA polymerase subunit L [archaeon]|nr:DNA-directed RNA polymerase subunit L [archaeon]
MEINILHSEKGSLRVELVGEDHTFANALRKQLWNQQGVKLAGYNIEHPLISHPVLVLDVDEKKDPKKVLLKAAEELKNNNLDLIAKLKKI